MANITDNFISPTKVNGRTIGITVNGTSTLATTTITTLCLSTDCRTTWPTSGEGGTGNVATSASEVQGNIPYWTTTAGTPAKLGTVATTSLGITAPITFSGTLGAQIGGVGGNFGCTTAAGGTTGCLSGTDWTTFNNKQASGYQISTTSGITVPQVAYFTNVTGTTLGGVSTSSETCTAPLFCGSHVVLGGGGAITWYGLSTTSQPSTSNLLTSNGTNGVYGTATSTLTPTAPLFGSFTQIGSGGSLSWYGLSTTSQPSASNVLVSNGTNGVYGAATSSETCTYPLSCGKYTVLSGGGAISSSFGTTTNTGIGNNLILYTSNGGVFAGTASSTLFGSATPGYVWAYENGSAGWFATSTGGGSGTVTSITAGDGLLGGTITTSGTFYGQVGTSSIPTVSNLPYWTSVGNANTPAKLGTVATTSITFSGPFNGYTGLGALVGGSNSTVTWTGLSTTTQPASSNLLVSNGGAGVFGVATTTASCSGGTSCTGFNILGSSPVTISSFSYPFVSQSYNSQTTAGTSSTLWLTNANQFSLAASSSLLTSASTTFLTVGTYLTIPSSATQSQTNAGAIALDTTNDQLKVGDGSVAAVFDPRVAFTFGIATSTAWTGSTTAPTITIPNSLTWTQISCTVQPKGATVNAQYQYANSSAYLTVNSTMVPASTTPGIYVLSSNNTPTANATSTITFGTPTGSPQSASCTLMGTVTGT